MVTVHRTSRLAALLAGVVLALPLAAQQPTTVAAATASASKPLDRANMDTTCAACTDFFEFANGGWLKHATIPAAYSRWGSFNELSDKNEAVVHSILEDAMRAAPKEKPSSNVYKIGTYYGTCMDSVQAERQGAAPIKPVLAQIDRIRTTADLKRAFGPLERDAGLAPWSFGAMPDMKQANMVIASAGQGGLGLPNRDFYFGEAPNFVKIRAAYVQHIARVFQLLGEDSTRAAADAQRVMAFETQLATASKSPVQLRDPNASYHKMTLAELQKQTPNIDWAAYTKAIGAPAFTEINVRQPEFMSAVDSLITAVPVDTWKAYFRYHTASEAAPALSSAFVNESFDFQRNFTGAAEQLPRWKRCAQATNRALGEVVGQEYVKRTFTPEAKQRALEMVNDLRDALHARIQSLAWMSDTTKQRALAKLDAFTRKIGYPDKWKDYSALAVKPGSYYANALSAENWARARNLEKIGKPVDKTEWGMTPPTVNAYYNPFYNEIVFPAGILQPPFFDPNADDAVNYGGMGAVIGHEMTHGFDDQGRQFDAQGNLRDWWTAEDATQYKARAQLVVDQFNGYTVVDSATHVNGNLTLGENIADLGGLTIAYEALQRKLARSGRPGLIDGFTPEQRFFLAWAQVWRQIQRDQAARAQVATDPHSPAEWRVNGPLSNMPEFRQAWGCKAGDPMVRPDDLRAQIW